MSNWKEAHGNWYDGTPPILNPRVTIPASRGHRSDILGDPEPYPDPFGTDLFDRVQAPTEGKQFLDNYMVAGSYGQQQNMPDYVYESLQRQMGPGYGFGDYKTEDMKNVINWNAGRLRI